jgi:hypothetical protein
LGRPKKGPRRAPPISEHNSQTRQVFHDVAVDQAIEITEFAEGYRKLNWTRLPLPRR